MAGLGAGSVVGFRHCSWNCYWRDTWRVDGVPQHSRIHRDAGWLAGVAGSDSGTEPGRNHSHTTAGLQVDWPGLCWADGWMGDCRDRRRCDHLAFACSQSCSSPSRPGGSQPGSYVDKDTRTLDRRGGFYLHDELIRDCARALCRHSYSRNHLSCHCSGRRLPDSEHDVWSLPLCDWR